MDEKKIIGRIRSAGPVSDEERQRLQEMRDKVMEEFPPRDPPRLQPASSGIGAQIRLAREARGLSWNSLAEKAGLSNSSIVRDIEYDREVTLANIEAVVAALGLKLELVEQTG
ncbi:MAG: helix-turn-helix transcriptional regulator [Bythopirellula sp.]|nr:helix-turn-helix transcriptional regulator [Bythopirellula sp.]